MAEHSSQVCRDCGAGPGFRLTDGRCDGCHQAATGRAPALTATEFLRDVCPKCGGVVGADDCEDCGWKPR